MKLRVLLALVVAAAAVVVIAGAGSASAATACCGNLRLLYFSGDAIRNYDFTSQSVSSTNVDWGIDLNFYNNADINKVKNALNPYGYSGTGSTMYGRLSDNGGASYVWDADGGRKKGGCFDQYTHYRIYANPAYDFNYSTGMGYWVFGSTHYDNQECFGGWHGKSEGAEWDVNSAADSAFGVANRYDWANYYNYEPYRQEGDHIWDQDGYASYVYVP
jgi:hypothetical protein